VDGDPLAPGAHPEDARAVGEEGADPVAAQGARERRVVPQTVDDGERARVDDVDAAPEGREPHLARRRLGDAVDPEVAQARGRRRPREEPAEAPGPEDRRAVLQRADPEPPAVVLEELADELAGERAGPPGLGGDAREAPPIAQEELEAIAAAGPQPAPAVGTSSGMASRRNAIVPARDSTPQARPRPAHEDHAGRPPPRRRRTRAEPTPDHVEAPRLAQPAGSRVRAAIGEV
jgi:hypothetical protein